MQLAISCSIFESFQEQRVVQESKCIKDIEIELLNLLASQQVKAKSGSAETLETLRNAGAISEYINHWTPQDVALFHHHGRLPVVASNI